MEIAQEVENAIRDGIREGVKQRLASGYADNPIAKMIQSCLEAKGDKFRAILKDALDSCLDDKEFREDIAKSVRHTLAKTLVARFGGELEKQVNVLKSDPTTRARITLAIEEIVKTKL